MTSTTTISRSVRPPAVPQPFRAAGLAVFALAATIAFTAGSAAAQVCGDVNADGSITVSDAQRVLRAAVDQPVELICATDQCQALEARVAALEALLAHVTVDGNNLVLTGMNFQVVSGSGKTEGAVNGKGNVIIGYNENNNDDRGGSHNLVIGPNHSYSSYGGIVAGNDNEIHGRSASVLGGNDNQADGNGSVIVSGKKNHTDADATVIVGGETNEVTGVSAVIVGGTDNEADGDAAVAVAGQKNQADGETSVVVAGESNRTTGRSSGIASGINNLASGPVSAVSGGNNNLVSGASSTIGGAGGRSLGSPGGWLAGSFGPTF